MYRIHGDNLSLQHVRDTVDNYHTLGNCDASGAIHVKQMLKILKH